MKSQWKSMVVMAALTLCMGIATPAWSQQVTPPPLADPLLETYAVHVTPFYQISNGWSAFLVIADTSQPNLSPGGSPINLFFFDSACNYVADEVVTVTQNGAEFFDVSTFAGAPDQGVILVDGLNSNILTYVLLVNGADESLIRLDSIPCQGPLVPADPNDPASPLVRLPCTANPADQPGTWLRYDIFNTIAATFGDVAPFQTNLYFFTALGDLEAVLRTYGNPLHGQWASDIRLVGYCDEINQGSRRLELACTQRVSLSSLAFPDLDVFPNPDCNNKPGHIVTVASDNGITPVPKDFSGFQETIASLAPPAMLIGTGYYHHRGP